MSTAIDKALGGMLKDEETQLKCSPEYAEKSQHRSHFGAGNEKAISDKTVYKESRVRECRCGECLRSAVVVRGKQWLKRSKRRR